MPTSYTSLLGLALPVTGELSGTWGDTVNDYITRYVDASVAGTQTISGSQTAVTLTVTNGTTLTQVGSGSSGSAQYAVINCTGNPAGLLTITAPASSRQYLIINATSTSQSVKIVGAGPTTGVTLVTGESAIVAWNGSDYVKVASSTADGVTTFSAGTTGFTPSTATSGAVTLAGTLATTNGGTGLTSFTANGVVYASSTSALTTGSALTFDGTNLGLSSSAAATAVKIDSSGRYKQFETYQSGVREFYVGYDSTDLVARIFNDNNRPISFGISGSEQMRLTSTGLGIGTSSPAYKLDVNGVIATGSGANRGFLYNDGSKILLESSSTYPLAFSVNGGVRATLDSSGNLGLGVTPSAWSPGKAIEVGFAGSGVYSYSQTDTELLSNAYYNAGYKYGGTGRAMMYGMGTAGAGIHAWYTAPSGTAGNAISFTQAMTLDASGNFLVGTTSASALAGSGRGLIELNGSTDSVYSYKSNNTLVGYTLGSSSEIRVATSTAIPLTFYTNATERARITSAGLFGLGVASPQAMFDLAGDYKEGVVTANTGTAYTINTANGTLQILTLTGNCTFTFPTAIAGESFTLLLRQDGTGGRTVTWPAAVRWPGGTAPTITSTASQTDKYIFTSDGTRWYGSNAGQAYAA